MDTRACYCNIYTYDGEVKRLFNFKTLRLDGQKTEIALNRAIIINATSLPSTKVRSSVTKVFLAM